MVKSIAMGTRSQHQAADQGREQLRKGKSELYEQTSFKWNQLSEGEKERLANKRTAAQAVTGVVGGVPGGSTAGGIGQIP